MKNTLNFNTYKTLLYFIGSVWLINGLLCKVSNLVPRHGQIVARILGERYAGTLTVMIGFAETGMAIWVLSRLKSRLNASFQIIMIAVMNVLEFFLAPDLLLWGRLNAVFAFLFMLTIYITEFKLNPEQT